MRRPRRVRLKYETGAAADAKAKVEIRRSVDLKIGHMTHNVK